jgi:hypothetical protein
MPVASTWPVVVVAIAASTPSAVRTITGCSGAPPRWLDRSGPFASSTPGGLISRSRSQPSCRGAYSC